MPVDLPSFLGTDVLSVLHGGYQSLVYVAYAEDGTRCVAKLRNSASTDRQILATQMLMVNELASLDPRVCSPLVKHGSYVSDVDDDGTTKYATLFEFADGQIPDAASAADVRLMGVELSRLHTSFRMLPDYEIPLVPALAAGGFARGDAPLQLIHGDFSIQNVRRDDTSVRIFDFDDSGYGTVEFDVANSLYMVLFDTVINDRVGEYQAFEEAFVDGYSTDAAKRPLDLEAIPSYIDLRVKALETWLAAPHTAPAGIRTATPEWRQTLRQFTERYWIRIRP